jgi:hypothetical protein
MPAISGKGDTFELDILKLIFNATAVANLADNAGTGPLTNLYVALHTADPLEAGDQTANEAAYTNYARVAVARSSAGWTCATASGTSTAKNAAAVAFPACGASGATVTHFSVGVAANGASKLLYGAALTSPLAIANGITPSFAINQLTVSED